MSTPISDLVKPAAFILTGSFPVISRDPLYVTELRRRGLTILVITSSAYRERATAQKLCHTAEPPTALRYMVSGPGTRSRGRNASLIESPI
jgi:hypothetical protein